MMADSVSAGWEPPRVRCCDLRLQRLTSMLHDRDVPDDLVEHWREPDEPIVFVVGAGFSRAMSDRMPPTDQLGEAAGAAASGLAAPAVP
jgi:hypothetical protein